MPCCPFAFVAVVAAAACVFADPSVGILGNGEKIAVDAPRQDPVATSYRDLLASATDRAALRTAAAVAAPTPAAAATSSSDARAIP